MDPAVGPGLRLMDLVPLLRAERLDDEGSLVLLFDALVTAVRTEIDRDPAGGGPDLMSVELAGPAVPIAKQILVESDRLTTDRQHLDGLAAARAADEQDGAGRQEDQIAAIISAARAGISEASERYPDTGGMTPF